MQTERCSTGTDRIERIRQMLEDKKEDPDLFSPEFRSFLPLDVAAQRAAKGKAAATARLDLSTVFSDYRISVLQAVEDGDKVIVRWRLRGTWTGPLPFAGVRPTDQPIDITGINIYRFVGSKIVEKTGEFDAAGFHDAACERLNPGVERVNPAECVKMLQAIARRPDALGGGGII
jgi:predicted ester cyclase